MDWTDGYFGELYDQSVADLFTARLSELEALVVQRLLQLGPEDQVLELACGHGRHARVLAPKVRSLVGLDKSREYLNRASGSGAFLVRGDLRTLPFASGSFDASFSWYSSLFMFEDQENERVLAEAARVLRPRGRLLVQHAHPERLAREPEARAERLLPDGQRVEEVSRFDPSTGVDVCRRRLVKLDGTVLEGTAYLRYYTPEEWSVLAARAGLRLLAITCTNDTKHGEPIDLIALAEKPSGTQRNVSTRAILR